MALGGVPLKSILTNILLAVSPLESDWVASLAGIHGWKKYLGIFIKFIFDLYIDILIYIYIY